METPTSTVTGPSPKQAGVQPELNLRQLAPEDVARPLLEKVASYNAQADVALLKHAIDFAVHYHGSQLRKSGDPYYSHPLEVSEILTEYRVDVATIITALLHDTVEDTEATLDDITREFGAEIAQLVDGVTKLTKIEYQSVDQHQAENFRKFLLAISEDIRVLLVKLADRLHNMRTLHFITKEEKRRRIAHETMEIYAPLAERIGMQKIKDELQDIAFRELHPEGFKSVESRLAFLREADKGLIDRITVQLQSMLDEEGIKGTVKGREKTPYSIWRKMHQKSVNFEQLTDIVAFRAIVERVDDCYRVLGLIHSHYRVIPDSFKDYISTPKHNGYQSIHTVVIGPENQRIEIQIRTRSMHQVAQLGVAAHWVYKQGQQYATEGKQYQWVRELLSILDQANEPKEFLENTKLQMFHDQVFCFTPKGDLIPLPKGATPVDFAYAVHSAVGNTCVGAKVNGRITPLRKALNNGDQVEIIQSKSQNPSPSWEHFVVTGKARSEIRRFVRLQQQKEFGKLGQDMLEGLLKQHEKQLHDEERKTMLQKFNCKTLDDFYVALGQGTITQNEVQRFLFPENIEAKKQAGLFDRLFTKKQKHKPTEEDQERRNAVAISGLIPGMAIHFAGCCHPLPGERIVGIVNTGKGITIHTFDCADLEQYIDQPQRWVDVGWESMEQDAMFLGRIHLVVVHKRGALGELANTIAQQEGNIHNIRIINRSMDFFELLLDVEVRDVNHLSVIMAALRAQPVIHSAERYKEGAQI